MSVKNNPFPLAFNLVIQLIDHGWLPLRQVPVIVRHSELLAGDHLGPNGDA